jgi:hypothetical protein
MNLTDPPVAALALAVKTGDLAEVERLLAEQPELATEHFTRRKGGTKTAAARRQAPKARPRATAARAEATASSVLPGAFTRIHAWSPTTLNP